MYSQEKADAVCGLYALCCPDTGQVRYIGKAKNPAARFKGHLSEKRRASPLYAWIAELRKDGKVPVLSVLASSWHWERTERALIAQYRAEGVGLLNVADGGNEPKCSTQQRAKNGRAVAASLHSDEKRKRIWEIKQCLGVALKRGCASESLKAKMRELGRRKPAMFGEWAAI